MQHDRRSILLLGAWFSLGALLAAVLAFAWLRTSTLKAWLADLQRWYALTAAPAPWWQRSDSHLHMTCSLLTCVWWGLGLRLFTRIPPLAAVPLAVLTALGDELCQLFSGERDFEWTDQFSDGIGIALAIPVLLWLGRR